MAEVQKFVRSRKGLLIHRAECHSVGKSANPWPYADGYNGERLRMLQAHYGYHFCGKCKPEEVK